jgi:pimeloyl-ACP methyl ester carboxylesterase
MGKGPPLVYAGTYLNNLRRDPTLVGVKHWLEGLSKYHTIVKSDMRGSGMSERDIPAVQFDDWVSDLEAIVDHLGLERFALFGMSQTGALCVAYAARHPDRVSHLVLHAPHIRAPNRLWSEKGRAKVAAFLTMIREYWDTDNPRVRGLFAEIVEFAPPDVQLALDEARRATISPETCVRVLEVMGDVDVTDLLPQVRAPTLILHPDIDHLVPVKNSRIAAAAIPDARLVLLDAKNHVVQEDEPGWPVLLQEVWRFLGVNETGPAAVAASHSSALSSREREVLALVAAGKTDAQIATALSIAPATASRHVHNILTKIGASRRSEAAAWWASNRNGAK